VLIEEEATRSEPGDGISIMVLEDDGFVVTIDASRLTREEVLAIAESVQPLTRKELAEYVSSVR
jgi:hypothetical protein